MKNIVDLNGINFQDVKSVDCRNSKIIIDGVDVTPDSKIINIKVEGDIDFLASGSGDVIISGSVGRDLTTGSGDVGVTGNVVGSLKTGSGNVKVKGDILGNIKTGSGDVECRKSKGSVETGSGRIKRK